MALLDFAALVLAQALIFGEVYERLQLASAWQAGAFLTPYILTNILFLYAVGCFRQDTLINPIGSMSRVPVALIFTGGLLFFYLHYGLAAVYSNAAVFRSISACAIIVLTTTGISFGAASASRMLFYFMIRRHWFRRRILVIGTGQRGAYLQSLMNQATHKAVSNLMFVPQSVLGIADSISSPAETVSSTAIIAVGNKSIEELAEELGVDEIVVAVDERRGLSIKRLLACKAAGIPVTEFATFIERETGRVDLRWLELSWLVYSHGFQRRALDIAIKRVFDITLSLFILAVTCPVLLAAMLAVYIESGAPIFYRQERVTSFGRAFRLIKLRSMRQDAEKAGAQWASVNDSRVTKVGAFLRKSRIDEIPQLFNVILGDMSLVGPRPERPVFTAQLSKAISLYDLRHSVRAGLTGWAQINYPYGASVEDSRKKLEYDLYYIKNYSIIRDALILLQTLRVVIWNTGAR
ncbi:TIGR03013 family XrtA/PEP-CTERM system glycosyltransferase [Aliidongia dinghuensis]|uniref:TIGR03013 family XrtA/PEP-CTERM system glycosyltransferase n=1 Tax=Aliidongia dinghuensis TaxID=1867774 RepID=UPI001666BF7C|nr:TIGR03013 family XrtA/PEP-CTERM system glycosyltransferase [Aliidongia dinghuensis]